VSHGHAGKVEHVQQAEDQRQPGRDQENQRPQQNAAKHCLPGGVVAEIDQAQRQQEDEIGCHQ
jgi:hypothetical protein